MSASFLASLDTGQLRWDLLRPFPEQDPADRRAGDALVTQVEALVASRVDPDRVDRTRELPDGLIDDLHAGGYFKLQLDADLGGLELSPYNAFRVIEQAASWSTPVGQMLGLVNGAGAGALLPSLPPGPLREAIRQRVAAGSVSGWADTEPTGQNNRLPTMTATPTDDGSGYVLSGEKVFTGNGPIADLLVVTAAVADEQEPRACLFFVDTASPGFRVASRLEFMGSNGLPNAALRFDNVHVPKELVFAVEGGDARLHPLISSVGLVGRLYIASAPAMAIARLCLKWSREFVARRSIDGCRLGEYDQIQRIIATTLAEVYAMESVVQWCLVDCGLTDRWYERIIAKNITTITSWRIVDRTMSLLAGEGFETASSKRRRGADPLPLERLFRDARGLRIAGNVDFQLDNQAARLLLGRHYGTPDTFTAVDADDLDPDLAQDANLAAANRDHLTTAATQIRSFTRMCIDITRHHAKPAELFAKEQALVLLNRIASELFTMCAVLAKTSQLTSGDADYSQNLADVYCTAARHRLADHWRRLAVETEPDYAKISRDWLAGTKMNRLITH